MMKPLIELKNIRLKFPLSVDFFDQLRFSHGRFHRVQKNVHALNDISLSVDKAETLCVVGESGCGKSTLGRVIMGLLSPNQGQVVYDQQRIDTLSAAKRRSYKRRMQMIFQNPYASLNPRMRIAKVLKEPIQFHQPELSTAEIQDKIDVLMESVGINPQWGTRYPHEFSGGQRQRISIARALAVDPEFIVADEPISALDVSIQAQVLNLLADAQETRSLTYFFITHDLSVVKHFANRVAVMYLGRLCELAPTQSLYSDPKHPYTKALLSAVPQLSTHRKSFIRLHGEVSSPINLPSGCVFHQRCPHANQRCQVEIPQLIQQTDSSQVACHALVEGRL